MDLFLNAVQFCQHTVSIIEQSIRQLRANAPSPQGLKGCQPRSNSICYFASDACTSFTKHYVGSMLVIISRLCAISTL